MVFDGFGTRLLAWKYLIRLLRSYVANDSSSSSVGAVMMSVVSSAYVYTQ